MIDSVTDNICLISNVCTVSKEIAGKSPIALPSSDTSPVAALPSSDTSPVAALPSSDTSPVAALPSSDTSLVAASLLDNAPASIVTCTQSSSATSSTTSSALTAAGQSSEVKASTLCASPTSKPTSRSPQLTLSSKDVEAIISNACKIARINVMDCTSPHGKAQVKRRERHRVRGRENLLKRLTEVKVACVFC